MIKSVYNQYTENHPSLRDQLAIERTALANERTLLSYIRTMVALIAVGGTLFQLSNHWLTSMAAVMTLIIGIIVFALGFTHFIQATQIIKKLQHQHDQNRGFTNKLMEWLTV